ncbi:hypothetical protein [Actinomycetospora chlora]|uniref:hypothetical protein n=1 Tax=Actinomycetospora chlora TaxID=663608 RepID=UPI0031EAB194
MATDPAGDDQPGTTTGSRRPGDVLARAIRAAGLEFNLRRRIEAMLANMRAYGHGEELRPDDQRTTVMAFQLCCLQARLPDLDPRPAPPFLEPTV